jgi:hypothetical protein
MERNLKLVRLVGVMLAIALVAVGAACGDDDDDDDGGGGGDDDAVGVPAAGSAPGEQPAGAAPPASILDRKIIFTAGITLSVDDVGASLRREPHRHGGRRLR